MTDAAPGEILFERRGALGLVTLNRPKALNALSLGMIRAMHAQLEAWEKDPEVTRVAVRGTGGRAFCAGGDIRRIYDHARAGDEHALYAMWQAEYHLVAYAARFPKPYLSLIDGIVMGGGVGISVHGDVRIASERYAFAMPEVGIGFIPDVGTTHLLPRLPGWTGTYLALTGARIGPGDAMTAGLATHHAPAADFDAILDGLAGGGDIAELLAARSAPVPATGPLVAERGLIDDCFSAESVTDILGRLDVAASAHSSFAAETAALLRTRSPTSLCLAREQMRRGPGLSLPEAILTEYRLVTRIMKGHDFYEGVRAVLVDKDNAPRWWPATLDAVDPAVIAAAFGPADQAEPSFA
ncbi:enoyl-CoA hydratase/isomerase family protein [Methylobacterium planeticum]|uniref:3-hydroxyisobutyryl-CoA hydrolase n=1 Tax=Methylobacterium planeticum TaxID=2615211 RepID=A0A6N6MR91_9HYPH|nr:enoyl-CoA hydratase/isomerase family protein [Methylobacterium planeticum]KAB1073658.1 enoyl-CoA hydratase/isomerase family protein [Methylobacterium planeticum]